MFVCWLVDIGINCCPQNIVWRVDVVSVFVTYYLVGIVNYGYFGAGFCAAQATLPFHAIEIFSMLGTKSLVLKH